MTIGGLGPLGHFEGFPKSGVPFWGSHLKGVIVVFVGRYKGM